MAIDIRDEQSIAVAKLYYESDMSQQKIAEVLNLSRPTVSRLLRYAKEQGYVNIKISDPVESMAVLENRLQIKYGLEVVKVARASMETVIEQKKAIGKLAAEYLVNIVKDGDIIGIGWGSTLYEMAKRLPVKPLPHTKVVELKGGISLNSNKTYAQEILDLFTQAFSAEGRYLPLPVMFDTVEVKDIVYKDKFIKHILQLGRDANIAVFTVGSASEGSTIFHLGYFINEEERQRIASSAVGDICSRFYDADGKICEPDLDARTVGITLSDLKKKQSRILLAGGKHKVSAIKAALCGKFATALVTDQYTAKLLLA